MNDVQRQTQPAHVRKPEIPGEQESRGDQPKDDHRNVNAGEGDRKKDDVGNGARYR